MLHHPNTDISPSPPTPNAKDQTTFDAAAYVDALRAIGAELQPLRTGKTRIGDPVDTFAVLPSASAKVRRRIAAIEDAFASRRKEDPFADGRVAEFLIEEAARKRFVAVVGSDFSAALREVAQLRDVADAANDQDYPDAEVNLVVACEWVLAMPIRRNKDVALKAEFAVRHCSWGDELQKVLIDIALFGSPDIASTLVPKDLS